MKIAIIVPGFSAHEQDWCIPALLDYVRALSERAEVHVFTLRWPEHGRTYRVFGATVHALDGRVHLGIRAVKLWARAFRAIAAEHHRAPFDVLHAFWADEPGWVAAWAARAFNVRLVLSLAGGELVGLPDIGYGLQLLPGRKLLIRSALRRATYVTVGSDYLRGLARSQCDPQKLVRVPLGVDTTLFSPPRLHARTNGTGVVLSVGALHPVKNHALLLRVFRRVVTQLPEAQLHIVGDGPLKDELLRLAEGLRVRFWGEVNHRELLRVYCQADVYVQTSRHEAQGMTLLEAGGCGLPLMGTPVGVLPEIGEVARDETELAQQVIGLLRDAPRRRALGQRARKKVAAEFSLAVTVERFMGLY